MKFYLIIGGHLCVASCNTQTLTQAEFSLSESGGLYSPKGDGATLAIQRSLNDEAELESYMAGYMSDEDAFECGILNHQGVCESVDYGISMGYADIHTNDTATEELNRLANTLK